MSDATHQRLRAIAALLSVPVEAFSKSANPWLLYGSENGDQWFLQRGSEETPIVRHVGYPASGGHVTERSVSHFLECDHGSPQHQALSALIERLLIAHLVAGQLVDTI